MKEETNLSHKPQRKRSQKQMVLYKGKKLPHFKEVKAKNGSRYRIVIDLFEIMRIEPQEIALFSHTKKAPVVISRKHKDEEIFSKLKAGDAIVAKVSSKLEKIRKKHIKAFNNDALPEHIRGHFQTVFTRGDTHTTLTWFFNEITLIDKEKVAENAYGEDLDGENVP